MNLLEGGWSFLAQELAGFAVALVALPLVLAAFIAVLVLIQYPRLGLEWLIDRLFRVFVSR